MHDEKEHRSLQDKSGYQQNIPSRDIMYSLLNKNGVAGSFVWKIANIRYQVLYE
ncbi:MAG TPA: hypothetical protein VIS49_08540 [Cyclobacteriaceae bacterium]